MRTTRKVAELRNAVPIGDFEVDALLQNPRGGYLVYMTCPKPSPRTIMGLGAIGSTLECAAHPNTYVTARRTRRRSSPSSHGYLPPTTT